MNQALAFIGFALLALILIYMAGRMFGAGLIQSWLKMKKQEENEHGSQDSKKE